ncbi:MAG: hypothetical protein VKO39_09985 [Cyanobacteriota bacterium]|nr:hypothetical protein [Cyanobacteriota bacterium]
MATFAGVQPHPAILRAVERSRFRVTAGDVASGTGLDLWRVERELLALAAAAGGHLQVADDGEMAYVFPSNLRAIRLGRVWWRWLREGRRRAWVIVFTVIRFSFGVVLMGLIIAVMLALAVAVLAVSKSGSAGNSDRGSYSLFRLFPSDAWIWIHPDPPRRRRDSRGGSARGRQGDGAGKNYNFFEAIFSFLFGDGNPNADLEDKRWRAIAAVIRRQRGVIISEQLAPFLDPVRPGAIQEEDVLPTLLRFNGQPHVSPDGDLVYAFPDLQVTAQEPPGDSTSRSQTSGGEVAPCLREDPWPFSRATPAQQATAGLLGGVLLALSISLQHYVGLYAAVFLGWQGWFSGLAQVGIAYSSAYLLLPVVRYLWLSRRNTRLQARNAWRRERARALQQGSPVMERKVAYASKHVRERRVDANDLTYSTERDLMTQEVENPDKVDAEWRRRLNLSQS